MPERHIITGFKPQISDGQANISQLFKIVAGFPLYTVSRCVCADTGDPGSLSLMAQKMVRSRSCGRIKASPSQRNSLLCWRKFPAAKSMSAMTVAFILDRKTAFRIHGAEGAPVMGAAGGDLEQNGVGFAWRPVDITFVVHVLSSGSFLVTMILGYLE